MNQFQPYYQPGPYSYTQPMGQFPMPYGQQPMNPYQNGYMNQMGTMAGMAGMAGMANMGNMMGMRAGMGINQASSIAQAGSGIGKLAGAFRGFNYSSFLDGTQKTLTTINQIIPLVYQVTPMLKNATTMFRVANEVRRMSSPAEATAQTVTAAPVQEPVIIEQEVETPIQRSAEQPTYF